MTNNDILRRLRYAFDFSDRECIKLCCLNSESSVTLSPDDIKSRMVKDDEDEGFIACTDFELSAFLEGLIISKRGAKPESASPATQTKPKKSPDEFQLSKNDVLRKLRIALTYQEGDMLSTLEKGGSELSKSELGAFFRNPKHKNYRKCGTQVLRNFIKGLTLTLRNIEETTTEIKT